MMVLDSNHDGAGLEGTAACDNESEEYPQHTVGGAVANSFFRIEKIKSPAQVSAAARHNKREISAELKPGGRINVGRTHLNYSLHGPSCSAEVIKEHFRRLDTAGSRPRISAKYPDKAGVLLIEALFSLPADAALDTQSYFHACLAWVASQFGGTDNVLSADVHLDEAAPHLHVLVTPLKDGKLDGSRMIGGKAVFAARAASFAMEIGRPFGLKTKKRTKADVDALGNAVIRQLKQANDPVLRSAAWPAIFAAVKKDPQVFATELGIENCGHEVAKRSFTDIMISEHDHRS